MNDEKPGPSFSLRDKKTNLIVKLFPYICLSVSLVLFIYIFYKKEIYWASQQNDFYNIYLIISSLLIIFSIITFFLNQKINQYLLISLISIIFSFYLFETYLTFKKQINYFVKTGEKFDMRNRFEIFNDLKQINPEIKVPIPHYKYIDNQSKIYPFSGISNSQTVFCNENGYYFIYDSDRFGFNNPDDQWNKKEIEYLLVGDSFIHGACVNRPFDIASQLRILSNGPVLNLGYNGHDPLTQYAILREYLNPNIKKILFFFYEGNDFIELRKSLKNDFLKKYLVDKKFKQNLQLKQDMINYFGNKSIDSTWGETQSKEIKKKFSDRFIKLLKLYNFRNIFINQPNIQKSQEIIAPEFKKIIELTKDLALLNNSELYFIYLPSYERYVQNYDNKNYNSVKKIINKLGVPFIDIHSNIFKIEKNPLKYFPFKSFGHYNELGYKKVAEEIYNFTKK